MNHFSHASMTKLVTCHEDIQRLFIEVLQVQDCTIVWGWRDKELQDEFFRTGHSQLPWPESKHNRMRSEIGVDGDAGPGPIDIPWSLAVDAVPYPIDWTNRYRFAWFAGTVLGVAHKLEIPIIWGGNWDGGDLERQRFDDLAHFELG